GRKSTPTKCPRMMFPASIAIKISESIACAPGSLFEPGGFDFSFFHFVAQPTSSPSRYVCAMNPGCALPPSGVRVLGAPGLRLPSSCVHRLTRPQTLVQGLACGFQNEAAIPASIQVPFDLTFHARRELPFQ